MIMAERLAIVTGVGFRGRAENMEDNIFNSKIVKPNIGAWVGKVLHDAGFEIILVARTEKKIKIICDSISTNESKDKIKYVAADLLKREDIEIVLREIGDKKQVNLVHCVGIGAGTYKVINDNPYLPFMEMPEELPVKEYEIVVKSLHYLMKYLYPIFKQQEETNVVVVSSMSGIRAYPRGYSHASAKAGLHHAVRSLALELNKEKIYISEVLPGIVDTGLYDNVNVQSSVREIAKAFGYSYELGKLPMMSPMEVAEAVKLCLMSDAHILAINLVAKGQWPNMGA